LEEVMAGLQLFPDECPEDIPYLVVQLALPPSTGPAQLWDHALWGAATWSPSPTDPPLSVWNLALWDYALWGAGQNWVDVSDRVLSVNLSAGFQDQTMQEWTSGSASIVLENNDGALSPDNNDYSAPYVINGVSSITPGFPVRVMLTHGTTTRTLIYGFAQSIEEEFAGHYGQREGDAAVVISVLDEWSRFAKVKGYAGAFDGDGDNLQDRITRILAGVFSGVIDSDPGQITYQATDLSGGTVSELNVTAKSEGGAIYLNGEGWVIGKERYSLIQDTASVVPQCVFGDAVGEIPWATIDLSPVTDEYVVNTAVYSCVSGTEQTASDVQSVYRYGRRDDPASGMDALMCQTDAQVMSLAQWNVLTRKDAKALVNSLQILPSGDIDVLIPLVLLLDVRNLVEVVIRPPSDQLHTITRSCFIYKIDYVFSGGEMAVTYSFAPADVYRAYASSRWDTGLWDSALWFY
jgi:hypothetical protein